MIVLPWPPSTLSGHNNGNPHVKAPIVAKHRAWANAATLAAKIEAPASDGDIRVVVTFYPPNNRGDRINYPIRMKPYFDGIADALGVNDKRFIPLFMFAEPVKNGGKVVVFIEPSQPRSIGEIAAQLCWKCAEQLERAA